MTTNTPRAMTRVQRRKFLKTCYFRMRRADELDARLRDIVEHFDAGHLSGEHFEGRGLVVIGESRSGKTKEINKALERLAANGARLECGLDIRLLQNVLDGETTWKALGLQLLKKLGYQLEASRTEHEIWSRVRKQLQRQGIWLVHIDECQHMFQTVGEKETRKLINSLKTFMKHREWPVLIILSGIPELLEKVNIDPQLRNLMTPYSLRPLDPFGDDLYEIDNFVVELGEALGLDVNDIRNEDIYLRMTYGHENLFGKTFSFLSDVFSALPEGETRVTSQHLADRYAHNTGCMPGQNVFLREDYEACNVGALMASD